MWSKIKNEPALATGAVLAVIGVASSFGLGITDGQRSAIVALVGAILALCGAGVVRQNVTPAGKAAQAQMVAQTTPHPASIDPEADAPERTA